KRLFESISIQSFRDFEVIVADDSDDDSVKDLVQSYEKNFRLRYYKNEIPLGTPANWNFAVSKASGEWIKLMHDDDWFFSEESLDIFYKQTTHNRKFIFSAYYSVKENNSRKLHRLSPFYRKKILESPYILFAQNVIGPPSVTLVHKSILEKYDARLKWRVDVEFYMRVLEQEKEFTYLDEPLINMGISETQVTQSAINNPKIELPEAWILLDKYGGAQLKNIIMYDTWWRLFRNMNIRNKDLLLSYVDQEWPEIILAIIRDLGKLPPALLGIGVFSKFFMSLSYLKNRSLAD
ncbi:MAG TPA: glycosyltransferase family 2 protein, partial [Chitinophagaceae bacterium]|nr:glycosyltransferase family 2 protein [Chitinophagaceae bacterium]